jgi:hypothetical protein
MMHAYHYWILYISLTSLSIYGFPADNQDETVGVTDTANTNIIDGMTIENRVLNVDDDDEQESMEVAASNIIDRYPRHQPSSSYKPDSSDDSSWSNEQDERTGKKL